VTIVEQIREELVEYSNDKDIEALIKTIGR